ncbi:uncharacterized protein N7500_006270 [Penicillium coprophilum]|uniref:uncharacterized protein n=1 Tax=Penicillium coprophilum TaxID=36646 RepID=UPI00239BBE2A|nr:uncharacterized protein N7500_006270 [Penicillium coprophilum]KAJ5164440.1 hypothetical protein N7500_006270 [Penicillium coprophilum]
MAYINQGYQGGFFPSSCFLLSFQPIKRAATGNKLPPWDHALGSLVRFAGDYHEKITRNPLDQTRRSMSDGHGLKLSPMPLRSENLCAKPRPLSKLESFDELVNSMCFQYYPIAITGNQVEAHEGDTR